MTTIYECCIIIKNFNLMVFIFKKEVFNLAAPNDRSKSDVKHEIVLYARNIDDEVSFAVELAGETLPYDKYFIPRHPGAPYVFEYVLSGKGYIEVDGVKHPVKAGDFYMINSYSRLDYYSDYDDPYQKIYVNCRGDLNRRLCQAFDIDLPYLIYPFPAAEKYIRAVHKVLCNPKSPLKNKDSSCGIIIHKMLSDLYENIQSTKSKQSDNIAFEIRAYLDQKICEKVTLDNIVDTFFVSKTRLIHLFQKNFGVSPYQYLISQRINMACSLLKNSNLSVREIAEILQFADPHYFSNFFKNKIGISPVDYRKNTHSS